MDRFSPYYNTPAEFGLRNVRPIAPYRFLYPFDDESRRRIAYYFDYEYAPEVDPTGYATEVIEYAEAWKRTPETGMLSAIERADGALTLFDTRADALLPELTLYGLEKAAYEYCDETHTGAGVTQHLRRLFPEVSFTEPQVLEFLSSLVANRLMVTDGDNYLSLAVRTPPVRKESRAPALSGCIVEPL